MKKRNTWISILILVITLIALGVCWFVKFQQENGDNEKFISNVCTANQGTQEDDYTVVATYGVEANGTPKKWVSEGMHGAQYDFTVYNNTDHDLYNWSIEIPMEKGCYVDSCWDGTYVVNHIEETDTYALTSQTADYNKEIFANSNRSFGFILYTLNELDLSSLKVTLKGTTELVAETNTLFGNILSIASILWFTALCLLLFEIFRSRAYEQRRLRDQQMITQSITTFTNFIDAKDPYTKGHSSRVALYSQEIARRMKMDEDEVELIYYIALLHDAGKIGIVDSILNKAGALTPEERNVIQSHTTMGGEILKSFTAIPGICDGALYHHERFDGKGYPSGLAGENIPLYARIICIADSYDAMSSNRCYRRHLEKDVILKELEENSGSQFDPDLVPYMIDMIHDGFTDGIQAQFNIE